MNWIKVSTGLLADDKVGAIADACRCDVPKAAGMVLGVLCHIPGKQPDANLSKVPDATLEAWAMWTGRRGVFAKAFRAAWCTDGVVTAWEKWNGSAQRDLAAKRDRAKAWREKQQRVSDTAPAPYPVPCDDRIPHRVPVRGESKENSSVLTQEEVETSPARAHESLPHAADAAPPAALREASAWVAPHGHAALASLLAHVPDAQEWVGILRGMASGLSMDHNRPCDPGRLAAAIEDFVAKGKHRERTGASPKLFRSFVKSAKAPVTRYPDQQTADEHKAEQLATIRRTNDLRRRTGQPEKPLPPWAAEIDAMFPDGRTFPDLGAP